MAELVADVAQLPEPLVRVPHNVGHHLTGLLQQLLNPEGVTLEVRIREDVRQPLAMLWMLLLHGRKGLGVAGSIFVGLLLQLWIESTMQSLDR